MGFGPPGFSQGSSSPPLPEMSANNLLGKHRFAIQFRESVGSWSNCADSRPGPLTTGLDFSAWAHVCSGLAPLSLGGMDGFAVRVSFVTL